MAFRKSNKKHRKNCGKPKKVKKWNGKSGIQSKDGSFKPISDDWMSMRDYMVMRGINGRLCIDFRNCSYVSVLYNIF